jgi:hypothetical protein
MKNQRKEYYYVVYYTRKVPNQSYVNSFQNIFKKSLSCLTCLLHRCVNPLSLNLLESSKKGVIRI